MQLNGGELLKLVLNGGNLLGIGKMDGIFMFVKMISPQGIVCLCPRAKFMYTAICTLNIFPLKPLDQSKVNFIGSLLAMGE